MIILFTFELLAAYSCVLMTDTLFNNESGIIPQDIYGPLKRFGFTVDADRTSATRRAAPEHCDWVMLYDKRDLIGACVERLGIDADFVVQADSSNIDSENLQCRIDLTFSSPGALWLFALEMQDPDVHKKLGHLPLKLIVDPDMDVTCHRPGRELDMKIGAGNSWAFKIAAKCGYDA